MHSKSEPIAIACAADNNYAMPLAVTVCSLLANLSSDQRVSLFLLDGGIEAFNKKKITQSIDRPTLDITWVKPSDIAARMLTDHLPSSDKWPITAYYRLLLPQIIPQHIQKVIYLDSDLIIQGDVVHLWNIAIGDYYALAVQDVCQPYIATTSHLNPENFGIPQDCKYFNSGVLVMNLQRWRSEGIAERILKFIDQNSEVLLFPDQDALNIVLASQWGELQPYWNQMHGIYAFSSWQESPYSQEAYAQAIYNPSVIHFTTLPKPWMTGCVHPKRDLFYTYLDHTAWSGWRNTVWRRTWRRLTKELNQLRFSVTPS